MLVSPFTFYRGAALIMAADLAEALCGVQDRRQHPSAFGGDGWIRMSCGTRSAGSMTWKRCPRKAPRSAVVRPRIGAGPAAG
jgi:hypothetical protein